MAQFRVMARHRDHSLSLVTLAENGRQAVNLARKFCDRIATASNGIALVRVEEWIGTLTEGEWKPVSLWHGGFSHRFAAQLATRNGRNGDQRSQALPRTGDPVECVLLNKKTRKGGWMGKLLKRGTEGPITNTVDVPQSARPGQTVMLRVGSISQDGTRIQFRWNQADNPECR
jgi:hypothetical protein